MQLITAHEKMLYNTAILILKNEADALDAIQDTILSCWENIPLLQENHYFKTWMTKILLNKCYDILRLQKRQIVTDTMPEVLDERDIDTPIAVQDAMGQLAMDDRLILSLFYFDDFSIKKIADILSISESAVKTRLTRSRHRFKAVYANSKEVAYENQA